MSILAPAAAPVLAPSTAIPPLPVCRFTVAGYQRLIRDGFLTEADRVELLEGYLVRKPMTRHPPHDIAVDRITDILAVLLPPGYRRRVQLAVTTAESQPEPDFSVVRTTAYMREARHPAASEVALVIEVADSSLDTDREHKGRICARAAIPVYWIVNVIERQVEVYTDPSGPTGDPAYGARRDFTSGRDVALGLDGVEAGLLAVADMLP